MTERFMDHNSFSLIYMSRRSAFPTRFNVQHRNLKSACASAHTNHRMALIVAEDPKRL